MGYKFNSKARKNLEGGGFFFIGDFFHRRRGQKARCISSALMELKACMKVNERDW